MRTHAHCISRSLPRDCLTLSSARRATLAQSRSLYLSLVQPCFLSHTIDISPCSGLNRHTLYSLTQIVYLGHSIQAATTLSTSWWATLTQSLSLRMSRLTSLFLGQKRYITMLSPIRPIQFVHSLTHIVYIGHSLQPVSLFRSHDDPM